MAEDYDFQIVSFPGAAETVVYGISESGVVVGEYGNIDFGNPISAINRGFVFNGTTFETIHVPNAISTAALDVNDHGVIVGEYLSRSGLTLGFIYENGEYSTITSPFGTSVSLTGINNAGTIIGNTSNDGFEENVDAFFLNQGEHQQFRFPQADQTFLWGINSAGDAAGVTKSPLGAGGLLTNDFRIIRFLGENIATTVARGINDMGLVVGEYQSIDSEFGFDVTVTTTGFAYDVATDSFQLLSFPAEDCTFSIDPFNPVLPSECNRSIRDVNNGGQYVGYADNGDGEYFAFIGTPKRESLDGDFDGDHALSAADIDLLTATVAAGTNDVRFDVDSNGRVDNQDRIYWVRELRNTWLGDSNLDGEFNSADLVFVFTANEYEDANPSNSIWKTGDWNGDLDFDSSDFVAAFQGGGYEQGPRAAVVPEFDSMKLVLLLGFINAMACRCREKSC
ncbi:MAG: hypothetical protein R3C28_28700 [Pirellulaceae bacterium]